MIITTHGNYKSASVDFGLYTDNDLMGSCYTTFQNTFYIFGGGYGGYVGYGGNGDISDWTKVSRNKQIICK